MGELARLALEATSAWVCKQLVERQVGPTEAQQVACHYVHAGGHPQLRRHEGRPVPPETMASTLRGLMRVIEPTVARLPFIFYEIVKMLFPLSVIYASMIDNFWDFVALSLLLCALWDTWRLLRRPTSALLVVLFVWILSPFMCFEAREGSPVN